MFMSRSPRKRALFAVLWLLVLNAFLGLVVVLGGSVSGTGGKVIASTFVIAAACLLALAGSTVVERVELLAFATIVANALGGILLLALLWDSPGGDGLVRVTCAVCSVGIYGSLASVLISRTRAADSTEVRWAQVLALAGFGGLTLLGVLASAGVSGSGGLKLAGAFAILGILGILAAPILRSANRDEAPTPEPSAARTLDELVGLRVVAINGAERDVLVFENGMHVRSQ